MILAVALHDCIGDDLNPGEDRNPSDDLNPSKDRNPSDDLTPSKDLKLGEDLKPGLPGEDLNPGVLGFLISKMFLNYREQMNSALPQFLRLVRVN